MHVSVVMDVMHETDSRLEKKKRNKNRDVESAAFGGYLRRIPAIVSTMAALDMYLRATNMSPLPLTL